MYFEPVFQTGRRSLQKPVKSSKGCSISRRTVMILSFRTDMPVQTVQIPISSLIRVYTVCHSVCIVWTHYSMVEPHAMNETYNRPPYILATGSGNKTWWSKIVSCIHKKSPWPKLFELFHFNRTPASCKGAIRTKVPSFQKVTYLATV